MVYIIVVDWMQPDGKIITLPMEVFKTKENAEKRLEERKSWNEEYMRYYITERWLQQ